MEIANVLVAFVAHGSDAIKRFIHAIARGHNVLTRRLRVLAEKDLTLHLLGNFNSGQGQNAGRKVNQ